MNIVRFPLYLDDRKPIEYISSDRKNAVKDFEKRVKSGEYQYTDNICLCGERDSTLDIVISEKDRYGISIKFLLCKKCSIIRTNKVLDYKSLADFYTNYYRQIYGHGLHSISDEFNGQVKKGEVYKKRLEKYISLKDINTVFDFGCGTGGVLLPFIEENRKLYGCDYDYERLKYGKKYGLNLLHSSDEKILIESKKYNLVILSHVMEHFANPIYELNNIFELISDDGYIMIIVPSSLYVGIDPHITCRFFQNVHIYNYNKEYLIGLFNALNMKIKYIDEESVCILQKPKNWKRSNLSFYHDRGLNYKYEEIINNFKKVVILNDIFKISIIRSHIVLFIIRLTNKIGITEQIRNIFGRR